MSEITLSKSLDEARKEVERRAQVYGTNDPATLEADIEATKICLEIKSGWVGLSANELFPDDTALLLAREEALIKEKLSRFTPGNS